MFSVLDCVAKSKFATACVFVVQFIFGVIVFIVSIQQTEAIDKYGNLVDQTTGNSLNWEKNMCGNAIVGYISPFNFFMKVGGKKYMMQCPWRERNSIMRMFFAGIMIIMTVLSTVLLFVRSSNHTPTLWAILKWFHFMCAVLMFVSFVLDCDGINSGFNSCSTDFKVQGTYIMYVVDVNGNRRSIADECFLTPFISIIFVDIIVVLFGFFVFFIHKRFNISPGDSQSQSPNKSGSSVNNASSAGATFGDPDTSAIPMTNSGGPNNIYDDNNTGSSPQPKTGGAYSDY